MYVCLTEISFYLELFEGIKYVSGKLFKKARRILQCDASMK